MDDWQRQAHWIWLPMACTVNQYGDFRQEFCVPACAGRIRLHISADSRYAAFVNGRYVPASQYADYPTYKVYDTVDITDWVRPGKNVLGIVGYYQGEDSSVYRLGPAGLLFAVVSERQVLLHSGEDTRCRLSRDYVSGAVERFSGQLSFSFHYRAEKQDGWQETAYTLSPEWLPAQKTGAHPPLFPRPVEPLEWKPRRTGRLISQGVFWDGADRSCPCGDRMQRAALAFRPAEELGLPKEPAGLPSADGLAVSAAQGDGVYLLVDLGREEAGVPEIELALPTSATVLIGFGEHLEDLRVRTGVGGRQFAAVYEGRAGRQTFTHYFKRTGCRYVMLYVYAPSCTLYYAGIRPTVYPVTYRPAFHCSDALHNRIFAVSRRTLELCMHEHYEDCPWREQALYAMDARTQMLCGYYVFGESRFAQASLRLLALGQREDGLLELCAPARVPVTIPVFSLSFVTAVCENVVYSGDVGFAGDMLPTVESVLHSFLSRRDENGLVPCFTEPAYWNFYEWREGLDGGAILRSETIPKTYDAPLNGWLSLTLANMQGLYTRLHNPVRAERCRQEREALNRAMNAFWDEERGAFATCLTAQGRSHFCELTQSLLVCAGVADRSRQDIVLRRLADRESGLIPITLSGALVKYDALMSRPELYARWVQEDIARIWGGMLAAGATSFWETERGAADFDRAGSLCHGWSAVPVYFYYRYVLGMGLDGSVDRPACCGLYEVGCVDSDEASKTGDPA